MIPSRLKELAGAAASAIDRAVAAVARVGTGGFAWPLFIGMGIGAGSLALRERDFARGLLRRRATLDFIAPGLVSVGTGVLLTLVLALGLAFLRARRGNPLGLRELYLHHLRVSAFVASAPLVVGLSLGIEASHAFLALTFAFVTAALATYSAYHALSDRVDPPPSKRPWAWIAVGLATAGYAGYVSFLALTNHWAFNTGRSDLGYYMSVFRQSSQGILLGCSLCGGGTHLTGHFDPILLFLSPLYWIYPFADTLLVLQTVWLASGAVPVFLFTRRETGSSGAGLALALAYLAYPALHGVNLFDFHSVALCIPLFVWLLHFLELGSARGYFVTLALVLLVREDMSLALVGVSVFAMLRGGRAARFGWITLLSAVVYFVVAKAFMMGRLDPLNNSSTGKGGYAYFYEELIPAGSATKALLGVLVTNPGFVLGKILTEEKLDFVSKLLVPLLCLPLLARGRVMLAYGAALTLLASRPFLFSIHFQYTSPLIPFLFVLAAGALGRIHRGDFGIVGVSPSRASRALALGVLVCTALSSWKFGAFFENRTFQGGFRPLKRETYPEQLEVDRWLRKVARSLPKGASVAASSRVLTHLGSVTHVYMLGDGNPAEYIVAGQDQKGEVRKVGEDEARGNLQRVDGIRNMGLYRVLRRDPSPRRPPKTEPRPPGPARDEEDDPGL